MRPGPAQESHTRCNKYQLYIDEKGCFHGFNQLASAAGPRSRKWLRRSGLLLPEIAEQNPQNLGFVEGGGVDLVDGAGAAAFAVDGFGDLAGIVPLG